MKKYYLGIDVGGTNLKACVFDEKGTLVARKNVNTPVKAPFYGHYERDMDVLDESLREVIKGAIDEAKEKEDLKPEDILCVAATGHGKGIYLAGKNGEHIRPAIASTDFRAEEIVRRWENDGTAQKARKTILGPIVACQPAPLLLWLKENEKDSYDRIGHIFEAKDYVRFYLTGEAIAEESDSSGTALMDLKKRAFSKELFDLYGIPEMFDKMPPVKKCSDICGYVSEEAAARTGLSKGTPVAGGMFDIDSCALSCGKLEDEDICVVTGTWSINEYPSKSPKTKAASTKVSLYCDGKSYLVEESSPTSAGNLEWSMETILGEKSYEKAENIAKKFKADGCRAVFLPFLYGSMDGYGEGTFARITTETTKEELLRAVFEGVAMSHRAHIERLLQSDSGKKRLRITGGAARSDIWMQIFADVCGMTVVSVDTKETGALGAVMAASVAVGRSKDLAEASEKMSGEIRTFYPDMDEHVKYEEKFRLFKKLTECYK